MSKNTNQSIRNSDAVFLGWQQTPWGTPMALFNITARGHPSYGSTVSEDTLRKFHLQIPQILPHQRGMKNLRSSVIAR